MVNKNNTDVFDRDALIALYHETWAEIHRLRNYEWRIAYYFIMLIGNIRLILVFEEGTGSVIAQKRIGLLKRKVKHYAISL